MPVLLFGIGALAFVAGLVMIGFGIPINEFSFGNTLIGAGTTASVGGLIIVGLAVAVRQLRQIAEALQNQTPARLAQPVDDLEFNGGARMVPPAQGRVPFPPRPKAAEPLSVEPGVRAAPSTGAPVEESFAPTLPNPDEAAQTVEEDVSLSPQHPQAAPAARPPGMADKGFAADWRSSPPPPPVPPSVRPQAANFDAMWPVEARPAKASTAGEPKSEPKPDLLLSRDAAAVKRAEPEAEKPRAVAILKSGVVDGMGYTLYVDGSIEAELPQGTLRFASINELRSHLEKNS